MGERTTKYGAVIQSETENSFERSNNTLKGASKKATPSEDDKMKSQPVQEETVVVSEQPSTEKTLALTKDGKLDIKSLLSDKKKPKSKTHSLYLDDDIYEKLEKVAKSNKVSVSKALNELLRTIL